MRTDAVWESGGCLKPEYQMQHNVASDISRCHAKREGQTTETDEQTQRIAKQDEKARRRHTEKRRITQSKADQKNKARQHRQKNKPYPQPKQKTKNYIHEKETTGVSAKQGARRAWLISDAKSFGFHGFRWIHGFCLWLSLPWDCLVLIGFDG